MVWPVGTSQSIAFANCLFMVQFSAFLCIFYQLAAGYRGFIKSKLDPLARAVGSSEFFPQEAHTIKFYCFGMLATIDVNI